jgi:hypothetical protein
MQDYARRNFITRLLSDFLEIDLGRKSSNACLLTSANFMDPPTMITWLDLRRMTFDVGKRFTLRIKATFYLLFGIMLIEGFLLFARAFDYIELKSVFTSYHWIILMAHFIFTFIFVARAFVEAALTNEATKGQISQLVSHRHLLERLLSDLPTLKSKDPDTIVNRDMRKCLVYMQL